MKQGVLSLVGICAFVVALSILGLIWDIVSGLIGDIDGLLLLFVCLLMGGVFSLMLLQIARAQGWLPLRRKKAEAPASNAGGPSPDPKK